MTERKISWNQLNRSKAKRLTYPEYEAIFNNEFVRRRFGSVIEIAGVKYDLAEAFITIDEHRYHDFMEEFINEKMASGEWVRLDGEIYTRTELERVFNLKPDEIVVERDPFY